MSFLVVVRTSPGIECMSRVHSIINDQSKSKTGLILSLCHNIYGRENNLEN